jgi:hypothetical protein
VTWLAVLGTIAVIAGFIGIGVLVDRKWSLLPRPEQLAVGPAPARPKPLYAPGAAAETAIATTADELTRIVGRRRHCRRPMERDGDESIRYGDRALTVVRLRCPVCGERESMYVELAPPA